MSSFSLKLSQSIEDVVYNYITLVSNNFKIPKQDLTSLWKNKICSDSKLGKTNSLKGDSPLLENTENFLNPERLLTCGKAELVALCKKYGHKCSGNKSLLMSRLLGKEENKSKPKRKTKKTVTPEPKVIKNIRANIPDVIIRRNKYNNYEHPETCLVFDNDSREVIGKQCNDGSIKELTKEDIDKCNAYKFKYVLPENLGKMSDLTEVKVEDIIEDEGPISDNGNEEEEVEEEVEEVEEEEEEVEEEEVEEEEEEVEEEEVEEEEELSEVEEEEELSEVEEEEELSEVELLDEELEEIDEEEIELEIEDSEDELIGEVY